MGTSSETVRINLYAFFIPQLTYWKTEDPENKKGIRIPPNRSKPKKLRHTLNDLPPYTNISMDIAVLNAYFISNHSNVINFTTLEGGENYDRTFLFIFIYLSLLGFVLFFKYVCIYVCVYVCMYVCMYVYVFFKIFIYVFIYLFIYLLSTYLFLFIILYYLL